MSNKDHNDTHEAISVKDNNGRHRNARARDIALQQLQNEPVATTSIIEYQSQGRLAIVGNAEQAVPIAEGLLNTLPGIVIIDPSDSHRDIRYDDRILVFHAKVADISGHLGAFQILLEESGKQTLNLQALLTREWTQIDLVLDLQSPPCFDAEISPPGYYASRGDPELLQQYIQDIPDMLGEFEKPRYFQYDPSICAHARNGVVACTRCIDACPTLAIHSIGEQIEVDPYLCQGGGTCVASCPSGAMQYRYPPLSDLLGRIRRLLQHYQQDGGDAARVLIIDAENSSTVDERLDQLADNLIPLVVDEIGIVDLAIILNTLAAGALQVALLIPEGCPASVRRSIEAQVELTHHLLDGMGYGRDCVLTCNIDELSNISAGQAQTRPSANHANFNDKRTMIHLALEHLHRHAPQPAVSLTLYPEAPFGEVRVDAQACTLCFACTGVCPTGALLSGNETPQLNFIEDSCVQCGLCEQTCPENAIRLQPRYLFDSERRRARRQLYAEEAFCCIKCGKPFATQHMIDTMLSRLGGHWMFSNPRALERLKMCEDCRVADLWEEQQG